MRKIMRVIITSLVLLGTSLPVGFSTEVWGNAQDIGHIGHLNPVISEDKNNTQTKANQPLGIGNKKAQQLRELKKEIDLKKQNTSREQGKHLEFILAQYKHQRAVFVDGTGVEKIKHQITELSNHYSPYVFNRTANVIEGANDKAEQFYNTEYRPLRALEALSDIAINEIDLKYKKNGVTAENIQDKYNINADILQKLAGQDGILDKFSADRARRDALHAEKSKSERMEGINSQKNDIDSMKSTVSKNLQAAGGAVASTILDKSLGSIKKQYDDAITMGVEGISESLMEGVDNFSEKISQGALLKGDPKLGCETILCYAGGMSTPECRDVIRNFLTRTDRGSRSATLAEQGRVLAMCPIGAGFDTLMNEVKKNSDEMFGEISNSISNGVNKNFDHVLQRLNTNNSLDNATKKASENVATFIPFILGDVPSKCNVNPPDFSLVLPNGATLVYETYNDEVRTIHFNLLDPMGRQSKAYPKNPLYVVELMVRDDRLSAYCGKYLAHPIVDIYMTPIYYRHKRTLHLNNDKGLWIGDNAINSILKATNKFKDSVDEAKRHIHSAYVLEKVNKEKGPSYQVVMKINSWYRAISSDLKVRNRFKNKKLEVFNNLDYVYDLKTKRKYYFGKWALVEPLSLDDYRQRRGEYMGKGEQSLEDQVKNYYNVDNNNKKNNELLSEYIEAFEKQLENPDL